MVEWSFDTGDARAAQRTRCEFVRRVRCFYGTDVDSTAAELVIGELIGNVVRYAPGSAHVRADFDDRGVTVAVADHGAGFERRTERRDSGFLRESGRGLGIVSRLATTLDINCSDERGGCCVTARLDARTAGS